MEVQGTGLRLPLIRAFSLNILLVGIGKTFNIFSYDAIMADNHPPLPPNAERMRYVSG